MCEQEEKSVRLARQDRNRSALEFLVVVSVMFLMLGVINYVCAGFIFVFYGFVCVMELYETGPEPEKTPQPTKLPLTAAEVEAHWKNMQRESAARAEEEAIQSAIRAAELAKKREPFQAFEDRAFLTIYGEGVHIRVATKDVVGCIKSVWHDDDDETDKITVEVLTRHTTYELPAVINIDETCLNKFFAAVKEVVDANKLKCTI